MDKFFKIAKFRSIMDAITDSLKNGQRCFSKLNFVSPSEVEHKNSPETSQKISEREIEKVKDEFKPFFHEGITLYEIALLRQEFDLKTTREELIELIKSSEGSIREFYKMFLFEPVTFLEECSKLHQELTNGFDPEGKMFLTILEDENYKTFNFEGENDCLLFRFSTEPTEEIKNIEFLKNAIKMTKESHQGGLDISKDEAFSYYNLYIPHASTFMSLAAKKSNSKNYSNLVDREVENGMKFNLSNPSDRHLLVSAVCGSYEIFTARFSRFSGKFQSIKDDYSRVVAEGVYKGLNSSERSLVSFCLFWFKDAFNMIIEAMILKMTGADRVSVSVLKRLNECFKDAVNDSDYKLFGGSKQESIRYVEKVVEKPVYRNVEKVVEKVVEKPVYRNVDHFIDRTIEKPIYRDVEKVVYRDVPQSISGGANEQNQKVTASEEFSRERAKITREFAHAYRSSWESIKSKLRDLFDQFAGKKLDNRQDIKEIIMSLSDVKPEARVMIKNILGFSGVDMYSRYIAALENCAKTCEKVQSFGGVKEDIVKIQGSLRGAREQYNTAFNHYINAKKESGETIRALYDYYPEGIDWKVSEIEEYSTLIRRFLYMLNDKAYTTKFEKENIDSIIKESSNKLAAIDNYYDSIIRFNETKVNNDRDITPQQKKFYDDLKQYYNLMKNVMKKYYEKVDVKLSKIQASGLSYRYSLKSYDVIVNILRNYLIGFSEASMKKHFVRLCSGLKQVNATKTIKEIFGTELDKGLGSIATFGDSAVKDFTLVYNPFEAVKALRKIIGSIGYVKTLVDILVELQIISPQETEEITNVITEINVLSAFSVNSPVKFEVQNTIPMSTNTYSIFSYDVLSIFDIGSTPTKDIPKGADTTFGDVPFEDWTFQMLASVLNNEKYSRNHAQELSIYIVQGICGIVLQGINKIIQANYSGNRNIFNLLGGSQGESPENESLESLENSLEDQSENCGEESTEGKQKGGNALFAMIKSPETIFDGFIEDAVPFYIIGYYIVNYYFAVYYDKDEAKNTFSLTISKYSPLYQIFNQLKTKQIENVAIETDENPYQELTKSGTGSEALKKLNERLGKIHYSIQDLKVLIGCLNKIWRTAESQDVKYKISSSVSKLFGELNSGLIFENKFSIEALKFGGGSSSMMIDMKISKYFDDIKNIMDVSTTYMSGSLYDTEKGFSNYINDIEKQLKESNSDKVEKLFALIANRETSSNVLGSYYKFMETTLTPLLICKKAYQKVFNLFSFGYSGVKYEISSEELNNTIRQLDVFYNEGIEPFEWTLARQISEDGSRVVELRNQMFSEIEGYLKIGRLTKQQKFAILKSFSENKNQPRDTITAKNGYTVAQLQGIWDIVLKYLEKAAVIQPDLDDATPDSIGLTNKGFRDAETKTKTVQEVVDIYNTIAFRGNVQKLLKDKRPDFKPWQISIRSSYPNRVPDVSIESQNSTSGGSNILSLLMLYPNIDYKKATLWDYFECAREEYINDFKHYLLSLAAFPGMPRETIKKINDTYAELENHTVEIRKKEYTKLSTIRVKDIPVEKFYPSPDNSTQGETIKITSVHPLGIATNNHDFEAFKSNDNVSIGNFSAKIDGTELYIYDVSAQSTAHNEEFASRSQIGSNYHSTWNFADWTIFMISQCDQISNHLPYKLYADIKANYFLNTYIKEAVCDYKTVVYQEIAKNRYYCPITQNIMLRSGSDINKLQSGDNTQLSPLWISNLVGIIPFIISVLKAVSKTFEETNNEYKLYQNLIVVISNFYNQISQFKDFTPFMNDIGLSKVNMFSIGACLQLMDMSPVEIKHRLEWANKYVFSATNLVFPSYKNKNVFGYLYDFLGSEYQNSINGDAFETTLAIVGKNTWFGVICSNSVQKFQDSMYGGALTLLDEDKFLTSIDIPTSTEKEKLAELIVNGTWRMKFDTFQNGSYCLFQNVIQPITKKTLTSISQYVPVLDIDVLNLTAANRLTSDYADPGKNRLVIFNSKEFENVYQMVDTKTIRALQPITFDYKGETPDTDKPTQNCNVFFIHQCLKMMNSTPWNFYKFKNEFDSDVIARVADRNTGGAKESFQKFDIPYFIFDVADPSNGFLNLAAKIYDDHDADVPASADIANIEGPLSPYGLTVKQFKHQMYDPLRTIGYGYLKFNSGFSPIRNLAIIAENLRKIQLKHKLDCLFIREFIYAKLITTEKCYIEAGKGLTTAFTNPNFWYRTFVTAGFLKDAASNVTNLELDGFQNIDTKEQKINPSGIPSAPWQLRDNGTYVAHGAAGATPGFKEDLGNLFDVDGGNTFLDTSASSKKLSVGKLLTASFAKLLNLTTKITPEAILRGECLVFINGQPGIDTRQGMADAFVNAVKLKKDYDVDHFRTALGTIYVVTDKNTIRDINSFKAGAAEVCTFTALAAASNKGEIEINKVKIAKDGIKTNMAIAFADADRRKNTKVFKLDELMEQTQTVLTTYPLIEVDSEISKLFDSELPERFNVIDYIETYLENSIGKPVYDMTTKDKIREIEESLIKKLPFYRTLNLQKITNQAGFLRSSFTVLDEDYRFSNNSAKFESVSNDAAVKPSRVDVDTYEINNLIAMLLHKGDELPNQLAATSIFGIYGGAVPSEYMNVAETLTPKFTYDELFRPIYYPQSEHLSYIGLNVFNGIFGRADSVKPIDVICSIFSVFDVSGISISSIFTQSLMPGTLFSAIKFKTIMQRIIETMKDVLKTVKQNGNNRNLISQTELLKVVQNLSDFDVMVLTEEVSYETDRYIQINPIITKQLRDIIENNLTEKIRDGLKVEMKSLKSSFFISVVMYNLALIRFIIKYAEFCRNLSYYSIDLDKNVPYDKSIISSSIN